MIIGSTSTRPNRPPRVTVAVILAVVIAVVGPLAVGIASLVAAVIGEIAPNSGAARMAVPFYILIGVACVSYGSLLVAVVVATARASASGRIATTILLALLLVFVVWRISVDLTPISDGSATEETFNGLFFLIAASWAIVVVGGITALILLWSGTSVKTYFSRTPTARD